MASGKLLKSGLGRRSATAPCRRPARRRTTTPPGATPPTRRPIRSASCSWSPAHRRSGGQFHAVRQRAGHRQVRTVPDGRLRQPGVDLRRRSQRALRAAGPPAKSLLGCLTLPTCPARKTVRPPSAPGCWSRRTFSEARHRRFAQGRYLRVVEALPKNYSIGIVSSGGKPFGSRPGHGFGRVGRAVSQRQDAAANQRRVVGRQRDFFRPRHEPHRSAGGQTGAGHGANPRRRLGLFPKRRRAGCFIFRCSTNISSAIHTMRSWVSVRPGGARLRRLPRDAQRHLGHLPARGRRNARPDSTAAVGHPFVVLRARHPTDLRPRLCRLPPRRRHRGRPTRPSTAPAHKVPDAGVASSPNPTSRCSWATTTPTWATRVPRSMEKMVTWRCPIPWRRGTTRCRR